MGRWDCDLVGEFGRGARMEEESKEEAEGEMGTYNQAKLVLRKQEAEPSCLVSREGHAAA